MNPSRIDTEAPSSKYDWPKDTEPSMLGLALNTLNGYRESGEGHWLDNAEADILRDMVRIACKELAEYLDAAPNEDLHYWQNRCLDVATALDQERVRRIHAESERDQLAVAARAFLAAVDLNIGPVTFNGARDQLLEALSGTTSTFPSGPGVDPRASGGPAEPVSHEGESDA